MKIYSDKSSTEHEEIKGRIKEVFDYLKGYFEKK
jgi:hypothetical protein